MKTLDFKGSVPHKIKDDQIVVMVKTLLEDSGARTYGKMRICHRSRHKQIVVDQLC